MDPGGTVRVLLIGDEVDPTTLSATLANWGVDAAEVLTASGTDEAMTVVGDRRIDCVVCPLDTSPVDGIEFVPILHSEDPGIPIALYPREPPDEVTVGANFLGIVDGYLARSEDTDAHDGLAELIVDAVAPAVGEGPSRGERPVGAAPGDGPTPAGSGPGQGTAGSSGAVPRYTGTGDGGIEGLTETLIENSSDVLSILDRDGTFAYVSPAIERILGHAPSELVGEQALEYVHPEDRQRVRDRFFDPREWEDDQRTLTYRFRSADDEWHQIESIATSRLEDPRIDGVVMNSRDVTERERRKEELERFETIVRTMPTGVVVVDEDGYVEWANRQFYEPIGETEEGIVGTHFLQLVHEGAFDEAVLYDYQDRIRTLLSSDNDQWRARYENYGYPVDGDRRIFETYVSLLPLEDGQFRGSVNVFRDVTERKEYQRELDLLKQVLTRVLRHNVRNSLNVIEGYAELLEAATTDQHRDRARIIARQANDLSEMTRKARTIQRVLSQDLDPRPTEVTGVVVEQLEALRDEHPDAEFAADLPRAAWAMAVDYLPTAVENVLSNAVVHNEGTARVEVSVEAGADHVDVVVADDGPGIPDHEASVIEDAHETPLEHGSGIGLWLVRWIVERSGGSVSFDDVEEGCRVRLRLDAADPPGDHGRSDAA